MQLISLSSVGVLTGTLLAMFEAHDRGCAPIVRMNLAIAMKLDERRVMEHNIPSIWN